MLRRIMAVLAVTLAGGAAAQDRLPGNLPWLWSTDIGTWGDGGRVELFASPVDEARQVGALGVIWYASDPATGDYDIVNVRYPALICGAIYFEGLTLVDAVQTGQEQIDLRVTIGQLDDAEAAIGGSGAAAARVVNAARSFDATICPG